MDRNHAADISARRGARSLSARRAWIEMSKLKPPIKSHRVALRKESVDRNSKNPMICIDEIPSLSARRAWIEISNSLTPARISSRSLSARRAWIEITKEKPMYWSEQVALRKESVDRNFAIAADLHFHTGRSPQGERG